MKKQLLIKQWTDENKPIGEALGYPDCCIKEFCNEPPQLMQGVPTKEQKQRLEAAYIDGFYTGFIPCAYHAKQIIEGKISLSSLIDNEKRANNPEYIIPYFPKA